MTNIEKWAEETAKEVLKSKAASDNLKEIFRTTSDNDFLYSIFGDCKTLEEMEKTANEVFTEN